MGEQIGQRLMGSIKRAIPRKTSEIPLGFPAHDNLGLAVSNSIAAIEMGAKIIDSSLQGLGRSSGNACTEVLLLALKKRGHDPKINFQKKHQKT